MRITSKMSTMLVERNINKNLSEMQRYNERLSSGKKISRPVDDPSGAVKSMTQKSAINSIEQYQRNVDNVDSFVGSTDVALDHLTSTLQRINELTVQALNETNTQTSRDAIASEIGELVDEIVSLGNTKIGNRYIFGGFQTTEPPFKAYKGNGDSSVGGPGGDLTDVNGNLRAGINDTQITKVDYIGDNNKMQVEIDDNVKLSYNITGEEAFKDVIGVVMKLRDDILKGDTATLNNSLDNLQEEITHSLEKRAEIGSKMNRVDRTKRKLEDQKIHTTELLANIEDVDLAEDTMNFKLKENVYKNSVSVGAKILQTSLLDFLR